MHDEQVDLVQVHSVALEELENDLWNELDRELEHASSLDHRDDVSAFGHLGREVGSVRAAPGPGDQPLGPAAVGVDEQVENADVVLAAGSDDNRPRAVPEENRAAA